MKTLKKADFELLQTAGTNPPFAKLEMTYCEVGFTINAILSVCRRALESDTQTDHEDRLEYARLLGIAQKLIPHSELEIIERLHAETTKTAG